MDTLDVAIELPADTLPYDEDITYAEQHSAATGPALADRIGRNKVYLLSESSVARASKVRRKSTIG